MMKKWFRKWLALPLVGVVVFAAARLLPAQVSTVATSLLLFAGTTEGPFRTRDWGRTWEPIERQEGAHADPQAVGATRVFHPIGPLVFMGGAGGLFVSADFGENWERRDVDADVFAMMPSRYPQADLTVFLGTADGLLKSEDLGQSFEPTQLVNTTVSRIAWPGPALVVACGNGVLISEDAGASFRGPGVGLPAGAVEAMALSSFFAVDPVIFASVGAKGVFRSSNGGDTWQAAGLGGHAVTDLFWLGPVLYAAAADALYESRDLGESWTRLTEGLRPRATTRILFPLAPGSGAVIFLGGEETIHQSNDGGLHWEAVGTLPGDVLTLATFPPQLDEGGGK